MLETNAFTTSIHLRYTTHGYVTEFVCDIKVLKDPLNTYYMGIGFEGGYFGIQTKTKTERWINYSVWNGKNGVKPILKESGGPEVVWRYFNHEGSGIQTHRVYYWGTNVTQRLWVAVRRSTEGNAIYSGYFLINGQWTLIARIERPGHAPYLTNIHSFLENFGVGNNMMRKAKYSNLIYKVENDKNWYIVNQAMATNAPPTNSDDSWLHSVQYDGFTMEIDGKTGTKTQSNMLTLPRRQRLVPDLTDSIIEVQYCLHSFVVKKAAGQGVKEWFFWTGIEGTNSVIHVANYTVDTAKHNVEDKIGECYQVAISSKQATTFTLSADGFQHDSSNKDPLGKASHVVSWDGNEKGLQNGQFDGGNGQYEYTVKYTLQYSQLSNPVYKGEDVQPPN
jgi:hypothetical protein